MVMNASECMARLGEYHAAGDTSKAVELCESAPCSDETICLRYLGYYYGKQNNLEKSFHYYLKAATLGSPKALSECWQVIRCIDYRGDKKKAIELCETPPCSEYFECQRYLAYNQGDVEKVLLLSLKIAEHGTSDDLYYVATLYRARKDLLLALDYFKRAAAAGSARANHRIGDFYAHGIGIPRDIKMAIQYYEKSAEHGFIIGKLLLLRTKWIQGGFVTKLCSIFKFFSTLIEMFMIRNPKDPRLVDFDSYCSNISPKFRQWLREK
jgi:TPR repeat protein